MKKLITRYRNYKFFKKALKEDLAFMNMPFLTQGCFRFYKNSKKDGCERNLAAAVIRKYRKKFPYHIQGWTENQKIYEEYFTLDGAIKSLEEVKEKLSKGDVHVTMFRNESVYKGEKPFQYNSVGTYGDKPITLKIKIYNEKYNSFYFYGSSSFWTLDEEWLTAYRYATEAEIEEYKESKSREKEIRKQIKIKEKEISNLYKKL